MCPSCEQYSRKLNRPNFLQTAHMLVGVMNVNKQPNK